MDSFQEQYIIVQKTNKKYHVDFFPAIDGGDRKMDGERYTIENMTVDELNHAIIGVHQLFEGGLLAGIDSIVIEGTALSPQDDRLLQIFSKVCADDYKKNVRYQTTTETN